MSQTILTATDFEEQAAAILAASKARRAEALMMADEDPGDADESDEDPGEDDDEGDESGEDEGDQPYVKDDGKPFTRRDYETLQATLKKERKDRREAQKAARGKPDAADEAAKAAEARYKPIIVNQAAKAAFTSAGLILPEGQEAKALAKARKLLDMDEIELTEDGEVEGLEEQIDEIRSLYPELFAKRTKAARRIDGADRGGRPGASGKSVDDQLVAMLRG